MSKPNSKSLEFCKQFADKNDKLVSSDDFFDYVQEKLKHQTTILLTPENVKDVTVSFESYQNDDFDEIIEYSFYCSHENFDASMATAKASLVYELTSCHYIHPFFYRKLDEITIGVGEIVLSVSKEMEYYLYGNCVPCHIYLVNAMLPVKIIKTVDRKRPDDTNVISAEKPRKAFGGLKSKLDTNDMRDIASFLEDYVFDEKTASENTTQGEYSPKYPEGEIS